MEIRLRPKRNLSATTRSAIWEKLLDTNFRSSMGMSKTDHISAGQLGESHVSFGAGTIDILAYARGVVTIEDENLSRVSCNQIERITDSILRMIRQSAHKPVDMEVTAIIHARPVKTVQQFLFKNIRFSPTRTFRKIFGNATVGTFILNVSKTLSIMFVAPDHIDFIYSGMTSTEQNHKAFVSGLFTTSMRYLETLSRRI